MALRLPLLIERTGDLSIDQAQRNANVTASVINGSPIGNGNFIGPITFAGGDEQVVMHRLPLHSGGVPAGWFCVDIATGNGTFRRSAWDDKTITIHSANACTASFWVFA